MRRDRVIRGEQRERIFLSSIRTCVRSEKQKKKEGIRDEKKKKDFPENWRINISKRIF